MISDGNVRYVNGLQMVDFILVKVTKRLKMKICSFCKRATRTIAQELTADHATLLKHRTSKHE